MLFHFQATTNNVDETERLTNLLRPVKLAAQIAKDTAEIFTSIPDTMVDIDKQFNSIMQNMGVGVGYSAAIKDNLSKGAYAVLKLGGDIKSATALQNEVVNQFNKNIVLSEDMYAKLYATTKVAGVAAGELLDGFDKAGMSITHITEQMYNTAKIARDMGVSSQVVSKNVVNNLEQLNRFNFVNGVDGLAKMAAKAAMLRIDMKQTLDFAEKMLNPEDAINMSAALQRLGNVSSDLIDPLKLMDLAQNNVPELQNQLSGLFKQYTFFNEETQAFEFFPDAKGKIRELAKELQIPQSEIEKMALGTASLDKKLADIDFSGFNDISEDTKSAIANLATLDKDTGEYTITTKNGDLVSVQKLLESYSGDIGGLQKYISGLEEEAGKTTEEKMMDLAKEQLGVTGLMAANLEAMTKSLGLQIASTKDGQKVLEKAATGVNIYAEAQQSLYQPEVKGGYKGQENQYNAGVLAQQRQYIKNDEINFVALGDAASDAAKELLKFGGNLAEIGKNIFDTHGTTPNKKVVKDAVYFPEQNQVINKDKNDLVVFAQKENINTETPQTQEILIPKIEIPDFSQSIISAINTLKLGQELPQTNLINEESIVRIYSQLMSKTTQPTNINYNTTNQEKTIQTISNEILDLSDSIEKLAINVNPKVEVINQQRELMEMLRNEFKILGEQNTNETNITNQNNLIQNTNTQLTSFVENFTKSFSNELPEIIQSTENLFNTKNTQNVVNTKNINETVVNQNLNNEITQLSQTLDKGFDMPIEEIGRIINSITIPKVVEPVKQTLPVNEVLNKPKEVETTTTPRETKINHQITITFKAEGNNQALQQIADKFQNDDRFKSKIIQSLEIKKSNYQVDSDNPYQNYVEQISIA